MTLGWMIVFAVVAPPAVVLEGSAFSGGAASLYGSHQYGCDGVGYVYSAATAPHDVMSVTFDLPELRDDDMLYLAAMDDDAASRCAIEITLNGVTLHRGASNFPDGRWMVRRMRLPSGTLRSTANELIIRCLEEEGVVGMPPWFMVAYAAIADGGWEAPDLADTQSLHIELPRELAPLPTPLRPGDSPGFPLRGTKGWRWTTEQYLAEIPILAAYGGNYLMNCYTSVFSHFPEFHNEWWRPLGAERKAGLIRVIESCRRHGITFCLALHPQFASPRPLDPESDADFHLMWQHYAWAQRQGVRWFNLSLDDVTWGDAGPAVGGRRHGELATRLLLRLRERDAEAQLSFVPVAYWGDGTSPDHRAYLEALGEALHPDVYLFWTGDGVVISRITRRAAESYRAVVKHRLLLWDNYPVNDAWHALHLGPVIGRAPDLCEVVDGYMSNPMCEESEANRIPLLTCLDYAYNPSDYDPDRSIGQAIAHLASSPVERHVLAQFAETYPGMLLTGGGTGTNSLRDRFSRATSPAEAADILRRARGLLRAMRRELPNQYVPARRVLEADVAWMEEGLTP